jgi:bifunctional enzyme CysN/CysC
MDIERQRLKIVIVGHVDHGKSTLIGRLFHDTDSLPEGKVEQIRQACEAEGMEFEYAFLLDALLEEQEQNITIDTTQIQFRTPKRNYVIIDAPGHKEFLKNMITGAAHADAAILLIDAQEGVQEQSRRHGYLLSLLGVKQVMVAINKMDLVDYKPEVYEELVASYQAFLKPLGVKPSHFIPISARHGENIIRPSDLMPWHAGPSILEALDSFHLPPTREGLPARFVIQDVYRFDHRRIIAGRLESGVLAVGDDIVFWPDRKRSSIRSIETWPDNRSAPARAAAGESISITLEEQIFVERGQIASHPNHGPIEGREFRANLFWLHPEPLRVGQLYTLKLATQSVEARLVEVHRVLDSSSLAEAREARAEVARNEVADVTLRARRPIAFDNSDFITETGRFVLLQGDRIGGGGIVHGAAYPTGTSSAVTSEHISWTDTEVSREDRIAHLGHRGAVIWLTGLSGAGKSTLSVALEASLFQRGVAAFVLDGDNLRHGLCSDLGFSHVDRAENVRRAVEAARLLAEAGHVVITALISPFREERAKARDIAARGGIPFAEVFVNAPLATCEQRDPKRLYQRARAGEIKGFTGIDSPYEPPATPELELRTDLLTKEACLGKLLALALGMASRKPMPLPGEEQSPAVTI